MSVNEWIEQYAEDKRIAIISDLIDAQAEGVTLPYSPGFIADQEIAGHVVDLETGEIVIGGGAK